MYPDVPRYSEGNHWYSLQNVNPLYYLQGSSTQEKELSPLTPMGLQTQITGGVGGSINGNIIQILPATVTKVTTPNVIDYDVFILTDNAYVYGVSQSQVTSLGRAQVVTGDNTGRIQIGFGGYLIYVSSLANAVYTLPLSDGSVAQSTTWVAGSGSGTTKYYGWTIASVEPFSNYLALSSAASSPITQSIVNLYPYSTGFTLGPQYQMDLGAGWNIIRLQNWNNQYLAIGATFSGNKVLTNPSTASTSNLSYIFFWNGVSARYQYSVRVPGGLVDMIVSNGTVYCVVLERYNQYGLYKVSGQRMTKVCGLNLGVNTTPGQALFVYPFGVGVNVGNPTGAFCITENGGEEFRFLIFSGTSGNLFGLGSSGYPYTSYQSLIYTESTSNLAQITAISQWIPLSTKLTSVDVMYDSAPTQVGDYIRVTLYSWAEDQTDGVLLQQLTDITSTTYDTKIKTTLDAKGLTPNMAKVKVETYSAPGSAWRPVIRQVQLNESSQ